MADEKPASLVKVLDELFAMQAIRQGDLVMYREVITTNFCEAVEELIENCGDADIINRADDLLAVLYVAETIDRSIAPTMYGDDTSTLTQLIDQMEAGEI